jgi:NAD(P)-dependent dehydrogenase (short-subunit alcohol dehydrogenase family)
MAERTEQELRGKVVLITGAARRIGKAIALDSARLGANVAITFQNSATEAEETVAELKSFGVKASLFRCNVADQKSVMETVARVREEMGRIDVLINNAGQYETVEFERLTVEQWDHMFATNARGPFIVSQAAAAELRRRKGKIINIGSLGGLKPWSTHAHYCSSKAALHMLTLCMAKALAPDVAVNAIAPGMIVQAETLDDDGLEAREHFAAKTPMKRNGTAEDVVAAVRFFATAPNFITGQVLTVDGGLGAT